MEILWIGAELEGVTPMANRIDQVIQEVRRTQHVTYRELARRCGIPEPTLHSARRRETIDGLSIDTFIHIASGSTTARTRATSTPTRDRPRSTRSSRASPIRGKT